MCDFLESRAECVWARLRSFRQCVSVRWRSSCNVAVMTWDKRGCVFVSVCLCARVFGPWGRPIGTRYYSCLFSSLQSLPVSTVSCLQHHATPAHLQTWAGYKYVVVVYKCVCLQHLERQPHYGDSPPMWGQKAAPHKVNHRILGWRLWIRHVGRCLPVHTEVVFLFSYLRLTIAAYLRLLHCALVFLRSWVWVENCCFM